MLCSVVEELMLHIQNANVSCHVAVQCEYCEYMDLTLSSKHVSRCSDTLSVKWPLLEVLLPDPQTHESVGHLNLS